MHTKLSAGGGNFAITATAIAVDLTALIGYEVAISCDAADILFSGALNGSSTTLVTGASAASATALVADKLAMGLKAKRQIRSDQPFLIVSTVTGSATLRVKVVSDKVPYV